MAVLHRHILLGNAHPCFLLPVFRMHPSGNLDYVQQINDRHQIVDFIPYEAGKTEDGLATDCSVERYIGQDALWAIIDHTEEIILGSYIELGEKSRRLLEDVKFRQHKMMAAELACFLDCSPKYPDILREAYNHMAAHTVDAASFWLDNCLLLPAIKKDLIRLFPKRASFGTVYDNIYLNSRESCTYIFASGLETSDIKELKNWREIAQIFGISTFEILDIHTDSYRKDEKLYDWIVFGIGGVARFVINRSPFFGTDTGRAFAALEVTARGDVSRQGLFYFAEFEKAALPKKILIAIFSSNKADVINIYDKGRFSDTASRIKHAINIRPIGHGTPNPSKISSFEVRSILKDFDTVWIVSAHRLKRLGTHFVSISASSAAARYARAGAAGLIDCIGSVDGQRMLDICNSIKGVGVIGASRYNSKSTRALLIKKVLHTMLSEDVVLHTARYIYILWPFKSDERMETVVLGSHEYEVQIISRNSRQGHSDVVGYAIDVRQSKKNFIEFSDFISSLADGYGWSTISANRNQLNLSKNGREITVSLFINQEELLNYIQTYPKINETLFVVTNKTVTTHMRKLAASAGWQPIHYSELSASLSQ